MLCFKKFSKNFTYIHLLLYEMNTHITLTEAWKAYSAICIRSNIWDLAVIESMLLTIKL